MTKKIPTEAEIVAGIAAYEREQRVFVRLLRRYGAFTSTQFDGWFVGREWRRPMKLSPRLTGDTFLLGVGRNGGNLWAVRLELLQAMVALGIVATKRLDAGVIAYVPGPAFGAEGHE